MKKIKIDKVSAVILAAFVIGSLIYLWGSQYYYPSNYLTATGVITQRTTGGGRGENNLYLEFQTQNGQQVSQIYQSFDFTLAPGQTIHLYYNKSNPHKIRVKPSGIQLTAELLITLVAIPVGGFVMIKRIKNNGIVKGLFTRSKS